MTGETRSGPAKLARWVRLRMVGVGAATLALLGAVAYRAYGLQIREVDRYRELAERQHVATVEVPAPRGVIYDATGAELAATADIDSVYADPQSIHDLGGTAERLAAILGLQVAEIEARLSSPRSFVWIERHVSAEEARAVRAAELEGVRLAPEPRRFYPGRSLAGPVLGFAGIDGRGLDGIELTMNEELAGARAKGAALRDATGALMLKGGVEPLPGASVRLTIDRFVQYTAERALAAAIERNRARAGTVVVLDVPTGGVLAMANWPTYDPNRPGGRERAAARNRAVTDVYEIGSIMKTFSIAVALEAGAVTPETRFDVEGGETKIGSGTVRDTYRDHILTVGGVMKRSSNIGAAKIALLVGAGRMRAGLVQFGFGDKTGIELPGEQGGVLRDAARWRPFELATISFGYGMSASALQVAAAMGAVASGGIYRPPRIVAEVQGGDRAPVRPERRERRVLSEKTALELRAMLATVFDGGPQRGTAAGIVLPGFRAAAKTGTAHKIDPATGRYGPHLYLASFAGFAPLEEPRVVVLVLIDEPAGADHYGAPVAGPAWVEIMVETLRYLGIPAGTSAAPPPASPAEPEPSAAVPPPLADAEVVGEGAPAEADDDSDTVELPDLTGLGAAEALEMAGPLCGRVQVSGTGRAIEQFPPPGRRRRPAECRIVLSHETGPRPRSSR